ncbi:Bifunctional DNA primase/polymerase, N-terminal [Mycobacteroides abscessus subsp. bolletii]|uniref:bifunctional DNA primase/polymerase n=1 Tax=Mycobacteroides abscessus TaxID=36809 RepID=UPI00092A8D24|nr:bifunctional DNA primase/polymerase [Mycobacteroides abscessus]SIJ03577.1 Bifunctional DNA primase/polymerase, N-terminal [Mycobacteroides abscessus subsp. bolletii]SLD76892.1 Bifunctional DNA primase/polymerase, N-terminal [Mycobacteroides abscessus subsp. bolletii]SLD84099.1 Bifunctional DNA primase/polymerase, N-terminal [Mycobacteroides abscessus subsp. bolletii]
MVTQSADNGQTKKLTRRKTSNAATQTASARSVPDVAGLPLADAARAYGSAGLAVLPVNPARPKNPGSYVGKGWPDKSSSDAEQITAWWQRWPNASIAIHTGKSGLVAFDLDIDVLPDELAWMRDGLFQATRTCGERGHYVFATADTFVSGHLALISGTVVGEVRSGNSVIVAAPSPHHKAKTEGGQYRWHRPGVIPALPEAAHTYLRTSAQRLSAQHQGVAEPITDETVRQFLAQATGNSRPKALAALTRKVAAARAGTRDEVRNTLRIAAGEARIGLYPFEDAIDEIESAARQSYEARGEDFDTHIGPHEYNRLVVNGVKFALSRPIEDLRAEANRQFGTDHRDSAGVFDNLTFQRSEPAVDDEAFWASRAVLTDLRQFARARRVAPWAVLGYVLARAVCAIPPHVVLPALVGSEASLNLFVALVGPSGAGKGGASGAAKSWLRTDPETVIATLGSGEGMAKVYAYKQKPTSANPAWTQVGLESAVLFDAPEVDNLAALSARNSSTLLPQLRSAYSGEELGFSYADPAKSVRLCAYRYRLCLTVGVQPGRGSGLLDDADGGTPQRFVWLPTTDPDIPDEAPEAPAAYELPIWPTNAGASKITLGATGALGLLDVPAKPGDLRTLTIPNVARTAIDEHRCKMLRGDTGTDPLDGHRLLCRLKVAAALMWLDRRTDEVSEQDWELAGMVIAVSDATRRSVVAALAEKAQASNRARGRADTVRAVAAEEARADMDAERIERVAKNVVSILEDFGGEESRSNVRKKLMSRDRSIFDEHVEQELIESGVIEVMESAGRGSKGYRLRLVERSGSK